MIRPISPILSGAPNLENLRNQSALGVQAENRVTQACSTSANLKIVFPIVFKRMGQMIVEARLLRDEINRPSRSSTAREQAQDIPLS